MVKHSFSLISQQHKSKSRKRKREGNLGANKKHSRKYNGGIENLPEDVLINILSHMSLNGAARTSVLSRRWRSLWRFCHGTLRFDTSLTNTKACKEFKSWVNTVLEGHRGRRIEGIVVNFDAGWDYPFAKWESCPVKDLVHFAACKKIQMLEVNFSGDNGFESEDYDSYNTFEFPSLKRLLSHSNGVTSNFRSLRTLRLIDVGIKDDVVHYFLVSCPNLEELCIHFSDLLNNLRVDDPPRLRVLVISRCHEIQSVEISAVNLVSLTYEGKGNSLLLKKVPNLRELTIGDDLCVSFVSEPREHSSYSVQLEKLVLDIQDLGGKYRRIVAPPDLPQLGSLIRLEVKVCIRLGRRLLFTSLIKGSPHLREFKIELSYAKYSKHRNYQRRAFPGIISKVGKFVHRNLKVVEMVGYIGCHFAEELLLALTRRCPSIERVVIDTKSDYYDDRRAVTTRSEAKERAKRLASNIPKPIPVSARRFVSNIPKPIQVIVL